MKYKIGDKVKFFDNKLTTIPTYGSIIKITPKSIVVDTSYGEYRLWNKDDHIHMLNFD